MTSTLRVLLVEDSAADAELTVRELRRSGGAIEHERVQDAASMRAALAGSAWDVVLSDWSMPCFSALEALETLAQSGQDLPFLIVSGAVSEESAVAAMRAGAHDYLLKGNLARLAPAIERKIRERGNRDARRRAEEALRASEKRYRSIVETTTQGVALTDIDARITYANAQLGAMLGYEPAELVGRRVFDLMDEESRADAECVIGNAQPGTPARAERRLQRKDGTHLWAQVEGTPVFDEKGRYDGRLAMLTDVSERRAAERTEKALHASESRFARLAESGIIGIAFTDVDGHFHDANDAYLTILGYERSDLAAGTFDWAALTPPEWKEADQRALEQLETEGIASPWEKELFAKDGRRVPVLVGVAMLEHPSCIAFMADLSERNYAEQALRRSEDQLRQAQKMDAVGRLAGGVAHDFNNILSVILGYASMILEGLQRDDPLHDDVTEIVTAGSRAADLTRQLLMFSRQQVVETKVLDLNDVLETMDKMLRRVLGEDIEVVSLTQRALGRVRADRGNLEQVILNLVINARDAMPTGGRLTLETADVELDELFARGHHGARPGPHIMLSVADTGVGMDHATQTRIFEPFFTTKETGKGTGLGLSTVFGIVQQSGGTVWVESALARGTTFRVYLPRVDAPAEVSAPTIAPTSLRGQETILLVEDEGQVRALVRGILARSGYRVIEARNGAEAMQLGEKEHGVIHLLLSDVVMPQMSGPALAKRLTMARPAMKVLCMSGYNDDSVVRHGLIEGHFAFIQKPITPNGLRRKVREVLDAR